MLCDILETLSENPVVVHYFEKNLSESSYKNIKYLASVTHQKLLQFSQCKEAEKEKFENSYQEASVRLFSAISNYITLYDYYPNEPLYHGVILQESFAEFLSRRFSDRIRERLSNSPELPEAIRRLSAVSDIIHFTFGICPKSEVDILAVPEAMNLAIRTVYEVQKNNQPQRDRNALSF